MQAARAKPAGLLTQLVAFDTTSAKSNLALIDFVRDYLDGHGVTSTLTPSADGGKASLFATIGPKGDGGIGLSGHSDCVPVEGQALVERSVPAHPARRQALWARHLRHEGLHRLRARLGAAVHGARS